MLANDKMLENINAKLDDLSSAMKINLVSNDKMLENINAKLDDFSSAMKINLALIRC